MKKNILTILIISLILLTGCESKTDKLEKEISNLKETINDMSTSTTTTTSSTTTSSSTTSTSKKTTTKKSTTNSSTTSNTTTKSTTKQTTTSPRIIMYWYDEENKPIRGYKDCSESGCKCYLMDGTPREC